MPYVVADILAEKIHTMLHLKTAFFALLHYDILPYLVKLKAIKKLTRIG